MKTKSVWTTDRPGVAGYYEVWDPKRGINRIVHVFRAKQGALAVRNFCRCKYAFLVQMWALPCFQGTHWRGPILVPEGVGVTEACALPHCSEGSA